MQYLKIPKERVNVLIGEGGETKRDIERLTKTKITVEDTSVSVEGDGVSEWIARDVVKAVGRGFSPEKALTLLSDENMLLVIDLTDHVSDSDRALTRFKGRIIGRDGKTRKVIEELTGCYLSVYGKTVSLVGSYDGVEVAKDAVLRILDGAPHSSVYRFLEKNRRKIPRF